MTDKPKKKGGPKGGIKHQPGRGHDRKSKPRKTRKFKRQAERQRQALREEARRQWETWDGMSAEARQ